MDRNPDERIETEDQSLDPSQPTQIETDVEFGGGGVLTPDDDGEVEPDETV